MSRFPTSSGAIERVIASDPAIRAYLDSSALVKLVIDEPESAPLKTAIGRFSTASSSEIAITEVGRRARRHGLETQILADRLLDTLSLRPVDATVLAAAARVSPEMLRALDAIHLATALSLEGLDLFISYDDRLNEAAAAAGLTVESPA